MNLELSSLPKTEELCYRLRQLYEQYGFIRFSMDRMEEYAFYIENMSFLQSTHVITFSDLDGRLMALKPDVTLSIVKNTTASADSLTKLYYTENVFRASKRSRQFRELKQMGLECLGDVNSYTIIETLNLASKSLAMISDSYVLAISHLGLAEGLISDLQLDKQFRNKLIRCINEKNPHDALKIAATAGLDKKSTQKLVDFISVPSDFDQALIILKEISKDSPSLEKPISLLDEIHQALSDSRIRLDVTIVSDSAYYNGIMMQGYIEGIPESVLSGGQYDNLLKRMGKERIRSIGFAVYIDALEAFYGFPIEKSDYKYLITNGYTHSDEIHRTVEMEIKAGNKVLVCTSIPEGTLENRIIDLRKQDKDA